MGRLQHAVKQLYEQAPGLQICVPRIADHCPGGARARNSASDWSSARLSLHSAAAPWKETSIHLSLAGEAIGRLHGILLCQDEVALRSPGRSIMDDEMTPADDVPIPAAVCNDAIGWVIDRARC